MPVYGEGMDDLGEADLRKKARHAEVKRRYTPPPKDNPDTTEGKPGAEARATST